jgi:hypothetical protein
MEKADSFKPVMKVQSTGSAASPGDSEAVVGDAASISPRYEDEALALKMELVNHVRLKHVTNLENCILTYDRLSTRLGSRHTTSSSYS